MLEELISSKARRKVLTLFLTHPKEKFYIRQIEKLINEPVGAIQRELPKLEKMGLLNSEYSGRVRYYSVDRSCPIFEELKHIVLKTAAVGEWIKKIIRKEKDIRCAFIYGSVAQNEEDIKSDIDLMVIGSIDDIRLHKKIQEIESAISRTINYNLMDLAEFRNRIRKKDAFLKRVLKGRRIDLIGNPNEL